MADSEPVGEPPSSFFERPDQDTRSAAAYGEGGLEALFSIRRARVLISGMNGLGVEIAKNLMMAGVGAVTLHGKQI